MKEEWFAFTNSTDRGMSATNRKNLKHWPTNEVLEVLGKYKNLLQLEIVTGKCFWR